MSEVFHTSMRMDVESLQELGENSIENTSPIIWNITMMAYKEWQPQEWKVTYKNLFHIIQIIPDLKIGISSKRTRFTNDKKTIQENPNSNQPCRTESLFSGYFLMLINEEW